MIISEIDWFLLLFSLNYCGGMAQLPDFNYVPPQWSARTQSDYYLEILKNGVAVESLVINQKAMYLVGKHGEVCDIVLENPSISRRHAVFQGKNNDEIFIYDLGSTHGTYVNNRKITPKLYHKLKIHDQIKFGQSQRIYLLRCQKLEEADLLTQEREQHERDLKKKSRQESRTLKDQYLGLLMKDPQYNFMKPKHKPKKEEEEEGITWGMIDEEEIYRYQQESDYPLEPDVLKKLEGLTTQQLERIKQYDEKQMKFRQVQDELDEILNKERLQFGLEEGLKRKKEKLQNKAGEYGNELDQAEETLRFILFGDKSFTSRLADQRKNESSEDDEYYDNTLANKKKKVKVEPEQIEEPVKLESTTQSYNELKKKLEDLVSERNKAQEQLLNLSRVNEEANKQIRSQEVEDALDSFMVQTSATLLQESRPKFLALIQSLQSQIEIIENKLRIVKPDIVSFTDFFDLKPTQKEVKSVAPAQKQPSIVFTLSQLKQLSKQREPQEQDDDEAILAKAQAHFEKERLRELEYQKKEIQEQKRKERMALISREIYYHQLVSTEEEAEQVPKKQYGTAVPPRSRHFTAKEVEKEEEVIDIVQFQ